MLYHIRLAPLISSKEGLVLVWQRVNAQMEDGFTPLPDSLLTGISTCITRNLEIVELYINKYICIYI